MAGASEESEPLLAVRVEPKTRYRPWRANLVGPLEVSFQDACRLGLTGGGARRRAEGDIPGWSEEISTRSARGRITNRNGELRSIASPSTPACTASAAVISRRSAVQVLPGERWASPGTSSKRIPR